jgi:ribosomal protein S9
MIKIVIAALREITTKIKKYGLKAARRAPQFSKR